MIGLVIVSHSAALADGVAELARGVAGPGVRIATAGGLELPGRPLGTDAQLVVRAIDQVYSDDGVLVLMDLGSAVLSAEMALEQLAPERRSRVRLCDAALVEGGVAAAVQARLGSSLEQVFAAAREALRPKSTQLAPPPTPEPEAVRMVPGDTRASRVLRLTVPNRLGLHARPAARFVQTAGRYAAEIHVRNVTAGRGPVSAKSVNAVATLGAQRGHAIEVTASGPDADAALAAIRALADANFGDDPGGAPPLPAAAVGDRPAVRPSDGAPIDGLPASPGIAVGPARLFRPPEPTIAVTAAVDPEREWETLGEALDTSRAELRRIRDEVARRAGADASAIFDAHILFLEDDALLAPARRGIFCDHLSAAAAWAQATEQVAAAYRALEDEYQRARAADVADVGGRVIRHLLGTPGGAPTLSAPGVLIAADLTPADAARLDPALVQGICTAFGAPTAHSAILARALGIPAVVGLGQRVLGAAEGASLIVDGDSGQVWLNPAPALLEDYRRRAADARAAGAPVRAESAGASPVTTRDGRRVEVAANIGSVAAARNAVAAGAEGVGLFRTEFLFLEQRVAPDEEAQVAVYRAAARELGGRPMIIRTLDAGGDKPLPYLDLQPEANPFLGLRGIRVSLAAPELFKTQCRAILRTAAEFPIRIMFPMIATPAEWRAARVLLGEARAELRGRGQPAPDAVETGMMVEVPAAAVRASAFAHEVDFFSIGTNDLTQYTMAAERGNEKVAPLADPFDPAVLQLIERVVGAAHAHGKWVGVCGEFAADPLAAPLLVGLGVDELSMSAPAIPGVREIVRGLGYAECRALAEEALPLETAEAVRARVRRWTELTRRV